MGPRSLSVLLILCAAPCGFAGQQDPQPRHARYSKGFASCYDAETGELKGSQFVRSSVLISADGHNRAYAESEALSSKPLGSTSVTPECQNTSRLYVAAAGSKAFECVYTMRPQEQQLVNFIALVDWSPDGRYLLMNEFVGQWGSDFGRNTVRRYDVSTRTLSDEGLVGKALRKHFGKQCDFVASTKGFYPTGGMVIRLGAVFDEEGQRDRDSCVKRDSSWFLDPVEGLLSPLSSSYKVQRFGRLADGSPSRAEPSTPDSSNP